ncbi:hypothetical protein HMPREF9711_03126 [Myroides odoratimimus CCUG 3837]|uniref:hypothetical protein n=1 Tax=Myroides odoratimimus TaxID=76832 RepID=UPI000280ACDD|nr:hypothetical protein [Myroides odoratimimus]EKB02664.1 hypothetical protein HMPREF9711_03126 [Myroides odoratimimus CCUG 3837]
MNDIGEKIVLASIGAAIALYLKYWYDQHLEDKKVNTYRKTIIQVIEQRLIPKYKSISEDYEKLHLKIKNHKAGDGLTILIQSYSLNENDLRDIFPLEDLIKVFNKNKNNTYNEILQIEDYIKVLNRFSPEILTKEYADELEELYKTDASIKDKLNCKEHYATQFETHIIYSKKIVKIYTSILEELKQKLKHE